MLLDGDIEQCHTNSEHRASVQLYKIQEFKY